MTPAARLQAAVEILDQVIASARDDGPPADSIVTRYFKTRRYAGSKDRRAVRELVFQRHPPLGERPASGRSRDARAGRRRRGSSAVRGSPHGPAPLATGRGALPSGASCPSGSSPSCRPLVAPDEWPALLERAPLDLRVNAARTDPRRIARRFPGAEPTPLSPWGLRLPADSRVDDHPAYRRRPGRGAGRGQPADRAGLRAADEGERLLDLCAGAGGKALALAAAAPGRDDPRHATAIAPGCRKLGPRANAPGRTIERGCSTRRTNSTSWPTGRAGADMVLVDAPCSAAAPGGAIPEGRWRLTPERLDRLVAAAARLLDIAAELVAPGGRLVYAVCSLLSREGAGADCGLPRAPFIVD